MGWVEAISWDAVHGTTYVGIACFVEWMEAKRGPPTKPNECANQETLLADSRVVTEDWLLGATGRTRPVHHNSWPSHGLRTTRGTPVGPVWIKTAPTTLESAKSVS